MIYFMEHRQSKPKRIKESYALDFYQMWFGNDRGQEMFDSGTSAHMPDAYEFRLWGEEISQSVWFKMILQGKAEDGYVNLTGDPREMVRSWSIE